MARGVRFGGKPKLTLHQVEQALRRPESGEPMTDTDRLWIILSHRLPNSEVVIERRSAASSEDAARIAVMMIGARNRLEHGDILRVLSSIDAENNSN
jgi:hypothetical protein